MQARQTKTRVPRIGEPLSLAETCSSEGPGSGVLGRVASLQPRQFSPQPATERGPSQRAGDLSSPLVLSGAVEEVQLPAHPSPASCSLHPVLHPLAAAGSIGEKTRARKAGSFIESTRKLLTWF